MTTEITSEALLMHYGRPQFVAPLPLMIMMLGALAGCSQDASVARVEGIVRLDGKPLTTGSVRFVPDAGRAATGTIQSDGTFVLGTYGRADGALVGNHRVAIIAYEASDNQRPPYERGSQSAKPLVPERYMAVGTSRLTFDVKPGDNQAEFDLQKTP